MAYKKGHIHPQKIRDKISASRKGIKFSDEQNRNYWIKYFKELIKNL